MKKAVSVFQDGAPWPYPRWIAHRGAGKAAPENTLAALRLGASHGYRMIECDVKLSADGLPFLLHDATLDRTSNGQGLAGKLSWGQLSQLDAGGWHSSAYAGEPLASLDAAARFCIARQIALNLEIKPSPGAEAATGSAVADAAAQLWAAAPDQLPPFLTSFSVEALEAAQSAQAQLPRGLLLDAMQNDWIETALRLGCVAVVLNHALWDGVTVYQARSAGLKRLAYTVNDEETANRLLALGIDALITDRLDFLPQAERFRSQRDL